MHIQAWKLMVAKTMLFCVGGMHSFQVQIRLAFFSLQFFLVWFFKRSYAGRWFQILFISPLLGEDSILTNMFQLGWNHQLAVYSFLWFVSGDFFKDSTMGFRIPWKTCLAKWAKKKWGTFAGSTWAANPRWCSKHSNGPSTVGLGLWKFPDLPHCIPNFRFGWVISEHILPGGLGLFTAVNLSYPQLFFVFFGCAALPHGFISCIISCLAAFSVGPMFECPPFMSNKKDCGIWKDVTLEIQSHLLRRYLEIGRLLQKDMYFPTLDFQGLC